ncbi:MAG TPA: hypothetical protein VLI05_05040 [Candidatus Saccharimonadia bacterium]|nr:hypothetical protein [Candidatus Saccharimonadia bacterium]
MREGNVLWQERRLEEILYSSSDPAAKVQQIMRLGFDEEIATELVERHLIGTQAPPYYESLSFDAEYDESLSEHQSQAAGEETA